MLDVEVVEVVAPPAIAVPQAPQENGPWSVMTYSGISDPPVAGISDPPVADISIRSAAWVDSTARTSSGFVTEYASAAPRACLASAKRVAGGKVLGIVVTP